MKLMPNFMNTFGRYLKRLVQNMPFTKRDLWRLSPLILISAIILWMTEGWKVFNWIIGAVCLTALISHVLRKLFWPYLEAETLYNKARTDPLASALVLCAVIVFCTVTFTQLMSFFVK